MRGSVAGDRIPLLFVGTIMKSESNQEGLECPEMNQDPKNVDASDQSTIGNDLEVATEVSSRLENSVSNRKSKEINESSFEAVSGGSNRLGGVNSSIDCNFEDSSAHLKPKTPGDQHGVQNTLLNQDGQSNRASCIAVEGGSSNIRKEPLIEKMPADQENRHKSNNTLMNGSLGIGMHPASDKINSVPSNAPESLQKGPGNGVSSGTKQHKFGKFDEDQLNAYRNLRVQGLNHIKALMVISTSKPAIHLPPKVPPVDVKLTKSQCAKLCGTLDEEQKVLFEAWQEQGLDCQDALTQVIGAARIVQASTLPEPAIGLPPRVPAVDVKLTKAQLAKLFSTLDEEQMMLFKAWREEDLDRQDALTQVVGTERIVEASKILVHPGLYWAWLEEELDLKDPCTPREHAKPTVEVTKIVEGGARNSREPLAKGASSEFPANTKGTLNRAYNPKIFDSSQLKFYNILREQGLDHEDALIKIIPPIRAKLHDDHWLQPKVPINAKLTNEQSPCVSNTLDEEGAGCISAASKSGSVIKEFENPSDILKKPSTRETLMRMCSTILNIFNKPSQLLYECFLRQGFTPQDAVTEVLDCNLPKERRPFTDGEKNKCRNWIHKFKDDKKKVYWALKGLGWSPQEAATMVHDISVMPVMKFRQNRRKKKKLKNLQKLAEKKHVAALAKAGRKRKLLSVPYAPAVSGSTK